MKNKIISWISQHIQGEAVINISSCSRVGIHNVKTDIPKLIHSSFSNKTIGGYLPVGFGSGEYDLSNITILGGICLLTTADMKSIYNKAPGYTFSSINEFRKWYSSWYPRLDQLHDSVGMFNNVKEIVYIVEDIFFAKRIALYTGLDVEDVASVFRDIHLSQGHKAMSSYLKNYGYRGKIRCVFISDVELKLDIAFRAWSRFLNVQIKEKDVDYSKVEIMYTNLWMDVLGVSGMGLIYEPSTKMVIRPWLKNSITLLQNNIGKGFNETLGALSYVPFLTSQGGMSNLLFSDVPNKGNFSNFDLTEDLHWYAMNVLFMKGKLRDQGLEPFSDQELENNIKEELIKIYS